MKSAVLTLTAALLVAAAAAHADTLLAPAPGAENVTATGDWSAWSAPAAGGRFKLVVRAPDGTVADAAIPTFATAPDADFGSDAFVEQQQVIVYSRCAGASTVKGCDVYEYNPQTKREFKLPGASSSAYSETAPTIASGSVGFVRRGGAHNGVYVVRTGGLSGRAPKVTRIDGHLARETAVSQSRIVFLYRNSKGSDDITISQLDGGRKRLLRRAKPGVLFNAMISRYKAGWLEHSGGAVLAKLTERIDPSDTHPVIHSGTRALPASTQSAAIAHDRVVDTYVDAEGAKRLSPPIFKG
jgi:hypothetical protein